MSLKLLIDEDAQDKLLVKLLREADHDVLTVNEAKLTSQPDHKIFDYAIKEERLVLTYNCDDFEALHSANSSHPGILAVYRDAERSQDMSFSAIVKALANLEASGIPLINQLIALNQWNY